MMKLGHSTAFFPVTQIDVGNGMEPLVVAEFGLNHCGSVELALQMVRTAAEAGCRAIKVQAYTTEEFCHPTETYTYKRRTLGGALVDVTEKQFDLFKRCELRFSDFQAIANEVRKHGMYWIATAADPVWARTMVILGVDALKVGSDDITHTPLLREIADLGVPVILSTGMANGPEINNAIREAKAAAILHCVSLYPTPREKANLGRLLALWATFGGPQGFPVGFSDHTDGVDASMVAMGMGAAIIEKHFTLSRRFRGPDHWFSMTPTELRTLCAFAKYRGNICKESTLDPNPQEAEVATLARRSIVAAVDLPSFHVIGWDDLAYRRPGTGINAARVDEVVGRVVTRPIAAGEQLQAEWLLPRGAPGSLAN